MKKTLILYLSAWGATKQYAEWIHAAVPDSELYPLPDFDLAQIDRYDAIAIGSRTYQGQIAAKNFLEKNWTFLNGKPVFLFVVGMLPPDFPPSVRAYQAISAEVRQGLAGYIKIPGHIDMKKLTFIQKMIAKAGATKEKYAMRPENIQPVIEFLKRDQ